MIVCSVCGKRAEIGNPIQHENKIAIHAKCKPQPPARDPDPLPFWKPVTGSSDAV